jgi:hypothetical protein
LFKIVQKFKVITDIWSSGIELNNFERRRHLNLERPKVIEQPLNAEGFERPKDLEQPLNAEGP